MMRPYEPRFVPRGKPMGGGSSLDMIKFNQVSWGDLWQPVAAQLVPRYLGNHAVGGEHHADYLGMGSYGYVVAAVDTQNGAEVAVKLNVVRYDSRKSRFKLYREVAMFSHLSRPEFTHPNVLRLLDVRADFEGHPHPVLRACERFVCHLP